MVHSAQSVPHSPVIDTDPYVPGVTGPGVTQSMPPSPVLDPSDNEAASGLTSPRFRRGSAHYISSQSARKSPVQDGSSDVPSWDLSQQTDYNSPWTDDVAAELRATQMARNSFLQQIEMAREETAKLKQRYPHADAVAALTLQLGSLQAQFKEAESKLEETEHSHSELSGQYVNKLFELVSRDQAIGSQKKEMEKLSKDILANMAKAREIEETLEIEREATRLAKLNSGANWKETRKLLESKDGKIQSVYDQMKSNSDAQHIKFGKLSALYHDTEQARKELQRDVDELRRQLKAHEPSLLQAKKSVEEAEQRATRREEAAGTKVSDIREELRKQTATAREEVANAQSYKTALEQKTGELKERGSKLKMLEKLKANEVKNRDSWKKKYEAAQAKVNANDNLPDLIAALATKDMKDALPKALEAKMAAANKARDDALAENRQLLEEKAAQDAHVIAVDTQNDQFLDELVVKEKKLAGETQLKEARERDIVLLNMQSQIFRTDAQAHLDQRNWVVRDIANKLAPFQDVLPPGMLDEMTAHYTQLFANTPRASAALIAEHNAEKQRQIDYEATLNQPAEPADNT